MTVPPVSRLAIDRISLKGVDAATAREVGPALERALGGAAINGPICRDGQSRIRIRLRAGAGADDIAAAVLRAVQGPP